MSRLSRPSLLTVTILLVAVVAAGAFTVADIRLASSQTVTLVAWQIEGGVPIDDPNASVWDKSARVDVPLSAQSLVPPMSSRDGTVSARALHDGQRLYIRLEWSDDKEDTLSESQTAFSDAAAVQFPVAEGEQVPPFCMGDPNAPVNIWQWKGSWQGSIDQRPAGEEPDTGGAVADLYPFDDEDAFYPPRVAGNIPARPDRMSPIDNLLAGSFGTLTAAEDQMVQGRGEWSNGRWRVVFVRDLAVEGDYTQFEIGGRANMAFAVWDGDQGERDGMKSVSQFATLEISPDAPAAAEGLDLSAGELGALVAAGVAVALLVTAGISYAVYRRRRTG